MLLLLPAPNACLPGLESANGDLRVPVNSPAVDYCDFSGAVRDILGSPNQFDVASNSNGSPGLGGAIGGIGAHEHGAEALVPIFVDDFESGDTSAWN